VTREARDFEAFFARRYELTRRALALMLGDGDLAEDAAQEAFARALSRWGHAARIDHPDAWVVRVGVNHARDVLRKRAREHRHRRHPVPSTDFTGAVDDSLAIRAELGNLTARRREAIVLRYYLDLSLDEVALAMGCALGTAKSTLHAALTDMRVAIPADEGAPRQ
jgi:RNA polymerase sigma factor (sigma-70 family)